MYGLLKSRWGSITIAQLSVIMTQFLILYVALRGVQGWDKPGTSVIAAFGAFATSQIMLMVPITPGGLGTVDALMISLLQSVGVGGGRDRSRPGVAGGVLRAADAAGPSSARGPIAVAATLDPDPTRARAVADRLDDLEHPDASGVEAWRDAALDSLARRLITGSETSVEDPAQTARMLASLADIRVRDTLLWDLAQLDSEGLTSSTEPDWQSCWCAQHRAEPWPPWRRAVPCSRGCWGTACER